MSILTNITSHWKTSLAGVLIGGTTIAGVLSQQGVTLGKAGTGTVVALIAAVCTALLGLIARDPADAPPVNLSSKIPPAAILAFLAAFLALPVMSGCKGPTATAPLAPGYANQADETMGQTLAGARSFYTSIATAKDLTDAEKTALNDLGKAINVAEAAYTSFHAGQVTQAAAQTAVDQVTAKQTAVEALGVKP